MENDSLVPSMCDISVVHTCDVCRCVVAVPLCALEGQRRMLSGFSITLTVPGVRLVASKPRDPFVSTPTVLGVPTAMPVVFHKSVGFLCLPSK